MSQDPYWPADGRRGQPGPAQNQYGHNSAYGQPIPAQFAHGPSPPSDVPAYAAPYAPPAEHSAIVPSQASAANEVLARMSELESAVMQHWFCAIAVPIALLFMLAWFGGACFFSVVIPWDGRDIGLALAIPQLLFTVVAFLFCCRLIASQANGLYQVSLIALGQMVLGGLGVAWAATANAQEWLYAFGIGTFFNFVIVVAAWVGGMARGRLLERRIPLFITLDDCGKWLATYSANDASRAVWAETQANFPPPDPYRR